MNDKIKLTPEQVEAISHIRRMWRNVTSIDLENRTPNGLHVTFNFLDTSVRSYSMDSSGEYIALNW